MFRLLPISTASIRVPGCVLPSGSVFRGEKLKHCLLVFLCLISFGGVYGQYTGVGTFTKISSVSDLSDGYYVITNESDASVMTNGRDGNETTGFFVHAEISPVGGVYTNPVVAGPYTMKLSQNMWDIDPAMQLPLKILLPT